MVAISDMETFKPAINPIASGCDFFCDEVEPELLREERREGWAGSGFTGDCDCDCEGDLEGSGRVARVVGLRTRVR